MKKYKSQERRQMDRLANGKVRYYYNEETDTETIITPAQEGRGEPTEDTHTVYLYDVIDLDEPVTSETKGILIDAMIRAKYSQADVEAILRHKIAGDAGAAAEFRAFNTYAEACKTEVARILGENDGE